MSEKVYVLIDHSGGEIRVPSLECLAVAQRMSEEAGFSTHAVVLGDDLQAVVGRISDKAVQSVLSIRDSKLADYQPDAYCEALRQILIEDQPHLLLMGHTYQNIDLAPKLSAVLNRALLTDCVDYRIENGNLVFVRQMFRSKVNADVRVNSEHPWIVTIQAGSGSVDDLKEGNPDTVERQVDLTQVEPRRKSLETFEATKGKVDLSKAEIIIAAGRGVKKPENMKILEQLAELLGAEIGASRPVVDNEWLGRDRQIGSSGQTVSPRLYVACGISGAIQHIVGMKNSGCIVAINTDPNAPIFNIANYGVVGDVLEVVPALIKVIKESKS